MSIGSDPDRVGATISATDATALAALDATGLPLGSVVYVSTLAIGFVLTLSSDALVDNQVVSVNGVDGYRWKVEQGGTGSIPLAELAPQAASTVVGNATGGNASPTALTRTQLTALLNAATASLPGAMSALLFAALQNVGAYSLDIDMTSTGDKGVIIPAQAGRFFIPRIYAVQVRALTGTASGTAPTISFGIPAGFTSYNPATALLTAAQINVGIGATVAGNATVSPLLGVANTDIHAAVGTAVTGATALTIRLTVSGFWADL